MSLAALPSELLDIVCRPLGKHDLRALALTNSHLHNAAQRHLYRHVAFNAYAPVLQFLKITSHHRQLALFVRSFSLRVDPSTPVFNPFVQCLAKALRNMHNITALDLVIHPDASHALRLALATDKSMTTYPLLAEFSTNFPFDDNVSLFLQHTPLVVDLQLGDSPHPTTVATTTTNEESLASSSSTSSSLMRFPATALPRLMFFMGSCEAASILVPGRPLNTVHVSGDLDDDVLSALALSSSPIAVFGALTNVPSSSLISSLAVKLPCLQHLHIMSMFPSSQGFDEIFYAEIQGILPKFPNLLTAELAGISWGSLDSRAKSRGETWAWQEHDEHADDGEDDEDALDATFIPQAGFGDNDFDISEAQLFDSLTFFAC